MAEYLIQSETLDDIVDAINAKTGGSSAMTPAQMVTAIAAIPSGGGEKSLTKILDVDVAEAVKIILVPEITEAIRNCESLYFLYSDVTFSGVDWLSLYVNGTRYYSASKATAYASGLGRFGISKPATIGGSAISGKSMLRDLIINNVPENFENGIFSLGVTTYSGNVDITAGHFEIWGWC